MIKRQPQDCLPPQDDVQLYAVPGGHDAQAATVQPTINFFIVCPSHTRRIWRVCGYTLCVGGCPCGGLAHLVRGTPSDGANIASCLTSKFTSTGARSTVSQSSGRSPKRSTIMRRMASFSSSLPTGLGGPTRRHSCCYTREAGISTR